MSAFHFLNVKQGDCHIIQHSSGRVTMIDICNGNASRYQVLEKIEAELRRMDSIAGDFGMRDTPTQPLNYLSDLGIKNLWRFILTHPDMDHMDGIAALFKAFTIANFWDSGARRPKPEFGILGRYKNEDWNRYQSIIKGEIAGLNVLRKRHGALFPYANEPANTHDGLYIIAPNETLIQEASEKCNRASYMILYQSRGGKILIPGDAEDSTWEFALSTYSADVQNCSILIAPHHGRHSDMDFSFLKTVNPKLVLMGCADSEDLAYDAYNDYPHLTNNQAGNVVAECTQGGIDIYVENADFAEAAAGSTSLTNKLGYSFLCHL